MRAREEARERDATEQESTVGEKQQNGEIRGLETGGKKLKAGPYDVTFD